MKTQNDATKREKKIQIQQPSALFFFKASHHLLIKERLNKPASVDHSSLQGSPREELAWIALKTNQSNTTQENLKNVYGIMCLSVVVHSTGRMQTQHTALLHNSDLFIDAYRCPKAVEGMNDTTRHSKNAVPWMLFQCSAPAVPSPVTLLVYRATLQQLFPTPLTCCNLYFPPFVFPVPGHELSTGGTK